jgi:hypothetical protein
MLRFLLLLFLFPYLLGVFYFLAAACFMAFVILVLSPICEITHLNSESVIAGMILLLAFGAVFMCYRKWRRGI